MRHRRKARSGATPKPSEDPILRSSGSEHAAGHLLPARAPQAELFVSTPFVIAAIASAGAGTVHAAVAGGQSGEPMVAVLFALCAVAQLGWAALVVGHPTRVVLVGGAVLNGGCVIAWVLSRTVGLIGPLAAVESLGAQDAGAAALGAVAAAAAVVALRSSTSPRRFDRGVITAAGFLVLVLVVPAMAAGHTHAGKDQHHDIAPVAAFAAASDPSTPIVSLDDHRLTSLQRARATTLLSTTRAAMTQFADKAHVVAAGYTWIGDGRRAGEYEHFVNAAYLGDGRELDPHHIESIVLQRKADGSERVVTAMYILERGTTLADAPDVAGTLTPWHDHQNLCWDARGIKLAGIVVNGRCRPGGTARPTPPMMHVWLSDPPCGPFSGLPGHGATNCTHQHPAGTSAPPTSTTPPVVKGRVTLRGTARLDGTAFDAEFIGAVVLDAGLATPCNVTIPAVVGGQFTLDVFGASELAGCGRPGATVVLWTYSGDAKLYSTRAIDWPTTEATAVTVDFSKAHPPGAAPTVLELSGAVHRANGKPVPAGARVDAYIDHTHCGVATVRTGDFNGYIMHVVSADSIPGCRARATITFRVNGALVVQTIANGSPPPRHFDLTLVRDRAA